MGNWTIRWNFGKEVYSPGESGLVHFWLENSARGGVVKGEVVALDGTAVKAYSQRSLDNKTGKSDRQARVGRGRRGFILGYKVHTVCCTSSELPLAFTVAPCDMNEKRFIQPLLKKLKGLGISFKTVLADTQYDSAKVRKAVREYGADPVIPHRKTSRIKNALKVGKDFIVRGVKRLVRLFRKRVSIERVFSRAKNGFS